MRHLVFLLLLLPGWSSAQSSDSTPRNQHSYGMQFFTGFAGPQESVGALGLEWEQRKSKRYSWIWTAGREWADTNESWGELPVAIPTVGQDSPSRTELRRFDDVRQSYYRAFVGGGPQLNRRLGSGDLGVSALLSLGYGQLRQRVTYLAFDYQGYEDRNEFPLSQYLEVARIEHHDLVQPGLRLQFHYTLWITPSFALRGGGYVRGIGGFAIGKYDQSTGTPRFRVNRAVRDHRRHFRPPFGDGLPADEYFQSPSPHQIHLRSGLTVGLVYKPQSAL